MKTIKITIDEYTKKKNKLKFLEFYWTEYTNQSNDPSSYPYASDIDRFINREIYDQINSEKVHSLTKRVTITEKNYELLKKYAYISDDLSSKL